MPAEPAAPSGDGGASSRQVRCGGAPGEPGRPSVALLGMFGIGNAGNEASLDAVIASVHRVEPTARITTISFDPDRVEARTGMGGVRLDCAGSLERAGGSRRWLRIALRPLVEVARGVAAYRHARSVDVIVVPGTGILDDYLTGPTQMPLDVARWSIATRIAGRRLLYLGIGAGPIVNRWSRALFRLALSQADFVSYRDEGSRRYMADLGRDTADDEVWLDVVFASDLATPGSGEDVPSRVAVGVMTYLGWHDHGEATLREYSRRIVDLVRRLQSMGREVRLVIGEDADLPTARQIAQDVGDTSVELCDAVDLRELAADLSGCELLVASRYHNVVTALSIGLPVISLGYARKNDWLMGRFGLEEYCQFVEDFDADVVIHQVLEVESNRQALAARIADHAQALRNETRRRLDDRIGEAIGTSSR